VKLSQVRLLVDDFGESFRFYRDVLGLETSFGEDDGPYASFRTEGGAIAIFERGGQAEVVGLRLPGDGAVVVLEVDDTDAEVERLREHVVAGPVDRTDWGGRVAYLRDPDGHLVELFQQIPTSG
jgi:catechol 2,3-dioxygenase-like lactoylglutathione lyase family enzyme